MAVTLNRMATAVWITAAVLVWSGVFDRVVSRAGADYLVAARQAVERAGPYERIDEWMRPAVPRGVRAATAAAGAVLLFGAFAMWLGRWRGRRAPAV